MSVFGIKKNEYGGGTLTPVEGGGTPIPSGISSWNDLEDKPFGDFNEIAVNTVYDDNTYSYSTPMECVPSFTTAGETVTVIFDGVTYECELETWLSDGIVTHYYFGNNGLYDYRSPSDELPFLWRYNTSGSSNMLYTKTGGNHTIEINGVSVVKTLETKYLPHEAVVEDDLEEFMIRLTLDGSSTSTQGSLFFTRVYDNLIADKTFDEILAAYKANKKIIVRYKCHVGNSTVSHHAFLTLTGVSTPSNEGTELSDNNTFYALYFAGTMPYKVEDYSDNNTVGISWVVANMNRYDGWSLTTYALPLTNAQMTE